MKKEVVRCNIAVHPIQAKIINNLQAGKIDFNIHSLRDIAKIINLNPPSAQQIQHHLNALVKLGTVQKLYGEYHFEKNEHAVPFKIPNELNYKFK